MDPVRPLFVFDGDCGFCRRWAAWLQPRTTSTSTFVPYQEIDLDALGLTPAQVQAASYWVDETGRTYRGSRGFAQAMRRGPLAWRVIGGVGDLPIVRTLLTPVYGLVARHRHRLPAPRIDADHPLA